MKIHCDARAAAISPCGRYRYALTRRLSTPGLVLQKDCERDRTAAFIMLNPSTADASLDDPTIRRCLGFAAAWDCATLLVLNLFAFRATKPADLKKADDPVGPLNWSYFHYHLAEPRPPGLVICAWGTHGGHRGQDRIVMGWLNEFRVSPFALGVTTDGFPRHPLYAPAFSPLVPFASADAAERSVIQ